MLTKGDAAYTRLLQVTPCGSQTLSKMPCRFVDGVYPKVLDHGKGGHVRDLDCNDYIDLISGLGAVSVGYADIGVDIAAWNQMCKGTTFSLPTTLEYQVSEKLCQLVPNTEMWKFGKNGTDATVMAVRAARAYTKRLNILSVGYNGCADQFEAAGTRRAGIPVEELAPLIHKAVYNDITTFNCLLDQTFACVIMEPMVYEFPKPGFLEAIRELCTATGTVLIFDEVVTGGRFARFSAQSHFNVVPDLTCLGKAIANGFPLSAAGGTRRFMAVFERDDFFASGTFGGETVSLAACLETVQQLSQMVDGMVEKGGAIKEAFNSIFYRKAKCEGYATRLVFTFPSPEHKALFMQEMCLNGVLIGAANFIMARHTAADVSAIINAFYKSYRILNDNWADPKAALKGKLPEAALKSRN